MDPFAIGEAYQAGRDAKARRAFGEHYTSEAVVLRTLEPLFLGALRSAVASASDPRQLHAVRQRVASVRFLDPACGCGNFLVVAYRELRRLEHEVLVRLRTAGQPHVQLANFYGIELDAHAADLAAAALELAERQCDLEFAERVGAAPERATNKSSATIVVGNALTIDWTSVCPPSSAVIVAGNPPFRGPKERSAAQSADLRAAWGPRYSGLLDYVTGWHAKAASYCVGDWAFVSTNSIVQGQAVPTLFGAMVDAGWRIKFAHRTFTWSVPPPSLPAAPGRRTAAVHCVVVGFTQDPTVQPVLIENDRASPVPTINAYLVDGPDILVTPRRTPLSPDLPAVQAGSKAVDWGFLTVSPAEFPDVAADPIAARYLRPYRGGDELINNLARWCFWFEGASLESLYQSPLLARRLAEVRARRLASPKAATRAAAATPHLFHERRQPSVPYLAIPQTFTENRPYATAGHLSPDVIASIKLFTSPDPDGFLFGIISSSMFMTWQKTVGGRMKSDPSFTNTVVWNTLPLPAVNPATRRAIAEAGRAVLATRDPAVPLAALYSPDPMSPALGAAHDSLDALVDALFAAGQPGRHTRQHTLFLRYAELVGEHPRASLIGS
ncbi:DNA methyltransferase [Cryptosporangium aurantiacum]|uniref:site-specific DNA-methyltransferase (adenine-specific) n=1 Tax=Cryptosporangium aurantiacum TaxID=134849 RepID=A0A1M7NFK2_9ACTN|nr:DNA methyltransferase [Cryptosporangium aurantiacum]SHN02027.1 hypothetical protein SAMN05443668_102574 [Cryptosporangium aurantiacum]